jgi:hypothetical protein
VSGSAVTRDAVGNELTSSRSYSSRNLMTALATTGGTPQATYTGKDVTFTQNGLTNHNGNPFFGCGCMQGALLHEIAHLMGYPDDDSQAGAKGLAYKCICAQNPNASVLDPPPPKGWKD